MPRPKNPNAMTPTERTARHRASREKRREVILTAEVNGKAERLMAERKLTFVALISALILKA